MLKDLLIIYSATRVELKYLKYLSLPALAILILDLSSLLYLFILLAKSDEEL